MVRETTSTRRPPGSSSSGSSRPPRAPQDAVEEEQYYDQDNAGVTFLKIDVLANFLLSIIRWRIICFAVSFVVRVKERGLGSTQYSQQFWAYTIYYMLHTSILYTIPNTLYDRRTQLICIWRFKCVNIQAGQLPPRVPLIGGLPPILTSFRIISS